jgi:predicted transcriptional regulator
MIGRHVCDAYDVDDGAAVSGLTLSNFSFNLMRERNMRILVMGNFKISDHAVSREASARNTLLRRIAKNDGATVARLRNYMSGIDAEKLNSMIEDLVNDGLVTFEEGPRVLKFYKADMK